MSPLSAVALLFLCATPSLASPNEFHQTASYSNGYHAVAASNSAPVVHTKSSFKGCSSATGCGSVTLENGKITESSGNPAALGLSEGETLDPSEIHRKFSLQADNLHSGFAANLPINGPLWWMSNDSPFKNSFEAYQKFIKENGLTIPQFPSPCGTPSCPFGAVNNAGGSDGSISNSIDIASNPFLNGQFGAAAGFASSSGPGAHSSQNPFTNGNINLPGFGSDQAAGSSFTSSTSSGGSMDLSKNPFLNGALSGATAPGCGGSGGSCGGTSQSVSYPQAGATRQQAAAGFQQAQATGCGGRPCGCSSGSCGCSGGNCGYEGQEQQPVNTGFDQTQTSGCGAGGCGFQDQQQVLSGFNNQGPVACSGPFCGQDQQVQQQFPPQSPNPNVPQQNIPKRPPVLPIPARPPILPIPARPPVQPIPTRPPSQPIPNRPPPGLPHPPGFTAGGFKNSVDADTNGELTVTCTGEGNICVDKSLCLNGYVNDNGENILQARSGVRCKASTEVCCRFKPKHHSQVEAQSYNNDVLSGSAVQPLYPTTGLIHVPGLPEENIGNHIGAPTNIQISSHKDFDQTRYDQQTYNSNTFSGTTISQTQIQGNRRPKFGNLDKIGTPYLPPEDTPKPYVYPEPVKPFNPTTQRPTTARTQYTSPYVAPTTRPTTRFVPTPAPTRPPKPYLPPKEDESPQPSSGSQQIVPRPGDSEGGLLLNDNRPPPSRPIGNVPPPQISSACAAALNCTPIEYCTADGMISNITVILTREQNEFRVPLTDCRDPTTGIIGKCCRDPYYTDPWPTNQLGRWIPEAFGDTGAYRADQYRRPNGNGNGQRNPNNRPINSGFGLNPAGSINNPIYTPNPNKINPSIQLQVPKNPGAVFGDSQQRETQRIPTYQPGQPIVAGKERFPVKGTRPVAPVFTTSNFGSQSTPVSNVNTENQYTTGELLLSGVAQGKQQFTNTQQSGATCGVRRTGTQPYGNKDLFEADFAEIPWQAMVLLQTNRSLLCGGVITAPDIVVTSAHCIDGFDAKNVLVKGGEWKLGIDEEPLPFQIVQVSKIHKHPEYFSGSLQNDFAVLVLAEKLRLAANIEPICLPPTNQNADARLYSGNKYQCITTGWGKQVLQINIPNSIMHTVDMNLIPPQQCQAQITQNYPHLLENYNPNTCICGQPGLAGANVCKVDIGSALACTNGDGIYYMEGVYSWDSGCTSQNQLASFYKFDAAWYQSAVSGQTNVQAQLFQQQQQIAGGQNAGYYNAQSQNQQREQQNQYSSQFKQTVYKQGRSFPLNGQRAFEQALNGHVHAAGEQCQCYEEGK